MRMRGHGVRAAADQSSMITVNGPSLMLVTAISAPKTPVCDPGAERAQIGYDGVDQRFGDGPGRGVDPGRTATLAGLPVQSELAHNQQGSAGTLAGLLVAQDP